MLSVYGNTRDVGGFNYIGSVPTLVESSLFSCSSSTVAYSTKAPLIDDEKREAC